LKSGERPALEVNRGVWAVNTPFKILINFVFIAALIPVAVGLMLAVDTSGWDATWVTIWNLLPLFAILAVLAIVAGFVYMKRGGFGAFVPAWLIPGVPEAFALYTAEIAVFAGVAVISVWAIRRMRRIGRSDPVPGA
jgi:hypothetical protein